MLKLKLDQESKYKSFPNTRNEKQKCFMKNMAELVIHGCPWEYLFCKQKSLRKAFVMKFIFRIVFKVKYVKNAFYQYMCVFQEIWCILLE